MPNLKKNLIWLYLIKYNYRGFRGVFLLHQCQNIKIIGNEWFVISSVAAHLNIAQYFLNKPPRNQNLKVNLSEKSNTIQLESWIYPYTNQEITHCPWLWITKPLPPASISDAKFKAIGIARTYECDRTSTRITWVIAITYPNGCIKSVLKTTHKSIQDRIERLIS